jgi:toxin ParE1/3/4
MKLQWTLPAVDDLENIRNYIARDSELYAAGFVEKIIAAVD